MLTAGHQTSDMSTDFIFCPMLLCNSIGQTTPEDYFNELRC